MFRARQGRGDIRPYARLGERLVEEGYLVTRPGAGIFVASSVPENLHLKARRRGRSVRAAVAPVPAEPARKPDFAQLDMRKYQLPLAPGMPAIDRFPWTTWAKLHNRVFRERPLDAIGYSDPQGELPLRESIAEYLATARGIDCRPEQIVLVSGSEQIVSIAAGQVARRGELAWFEDPGYPFLRNVLGACGLTPVPVPVDRHGLNVEEGLRVAPQARLAVVSPSHQYPLGVSMALERRMALIEWSATTQSWILENEIDGDYRYSSRPVPPIYALARGRRVFYCGSLSKPLAPGLRVNYLVAPADFASSLAIRTTLVPMLTQLVLARFNSEGHLASHMNKMRRLYARRRSVLLDALRSEAAEFLDVGSIPEAGLRVTASLLVEASDVRIAAECLKAGIQVDPLSVCFASAPRRSGLIVGFASTPEDRIVPAVRVLVGVLRKVSAEPD